MFCRQRGVSPSSAAWGRWFDLAPGWGPRLRHQSDEPDVAATCWALERKRLADPGHKLGPRNPGSVMPTGLRIRVAAARGMRLAPMPAACALPAYPPAAASRRLPMFPIASAVTACLSLGFGANTP